LRCLLYVPWPGVQSLSMLYGIHGEIYDLANPNIQCPVVQQREGVLPVMTCLLYSSWGCGI